MFRCPLLACILLALLLAGSSSRRNAGEAKTFDATTHADTNLIDMVLTNYGSFAWDVVTGDPGLIDPNGTGRAVVFAAGLWMGARVSGDLRVSVAEDSLTYGPGPILSAGVRADPMDERYRTYKIEPGESRQDDAECPVDDGAALGGEGYFRVLGEQTLWSVFDDLDPALRTNSAATPLPLGIEVRHATFADDDCAVTERTVFLE